MNKLNLESLCNYVNSHIVKFHERRIEIISSLSLSTLTNKNPYLFRAKNTTTANEIIQDTLEAFLSSSEEKLFGDFLEELAIEVAANTCGGHKSTAQGMDLEYENKGIYYVVSIKSGPNWGNSSQHKKLTQDFLLAERRLRQSSHIQNVQKILGICYGKTKTSLTSEGYYKVVGQNFWTLISDNENLYIDIIEPIGFRAKEHNDRFLEAKAKITNQLTLQFLMQFCHSDGSINWSKLLSQNSGNLDLSDFSGI